MPHALAALLVQVGLSAALASAVATAIVTTAISVGISFVSRLLFGGSGVKSEATERTIKTPIPPRQFAYGERRIFGTQMAFETNEFGSTVDVFAFLDGQANAVTRIYLNDDIVTVADEVVNVGEDGRYGASSCTLGYNLGLPTETAFGAVVATLQGIWTTAHRGDGIVGGFLIKTAVSQKKFLEIYPQGDNVSMSLVIQAQLCFDPRGQDPDDPSTWTYTTNAALHLLHYYMVRRGYDYTTRFLPVIDMWIDAANDCDVAQSLDAGGTEPRYRGCVVYDSTKLPGDIISELLACFDGWVAEDGEGRMRVFSGRFYTPTVTIGPDQIVSYRLQSFVEDEDTTNELIVQYVSAENDYNTVEADAWRDEFDISARGKVNSDGFSPQVPSHTQARRLAKRAMIRRNAPYRGSITTNFGGRDVVDERYISILIEEAGSTFFTGTVEVLGAERDYETGGVRFDWVAVGEDVDDWDPETEDGNGAPSAERIPVEMLEAVTIDAATAVITPDGTSAQIDIMITLSEELEARTDLTWHARWRIDGDTLWNESSYSDIDAGTLVELLVGLVPVNALIEIEVAYMAGDGRFSPWSSTEAVDTTTDGITPAPPIGFSVTGGTGQADAYWTTPMSPSFVDARLYRNTSDDFGTASVVTTEAEMPGSLDSYSDTGLAADTYFYWIVSRNGTGDESAPIASGPVVVA